MIVGINQLTQNCKHDILLSRDLCPTAGNSGHLTRHTTPKRLRRFYDVQCMIFLHCRMGLGWTGDEPCRAHCLQPRVCHTIEAESNNAADSNITKDAGHTRKPVNGCMHDMNTARHGVTTATGGLHRLQKLSSKTEVGRVRLCGMNVRLHTKSFSLK